MQKNTQEIAKNSVDWIRYAAKLITVLAHVFHVILLQKQNHKAGKAGISPVCCMWNQLPRPATDIRLNRYLPNATVKEGYPRPHTFWHTICFHRN